MTMESITQPYIIPENLKIDLRKKNISILYTCSHDVQC